ncbi:transposase [Nonomuraea rosea]|uniref:transposase n=1 Tax=Nonomuraea rosea TaxID=638574 RepID=UPI003CD07421
MRVEFSQRDDSRCPVKAECTRSRRRRLTLQPQAEHEVLARARAEQHTDQWDIALRRLRPEGVP